MELKKPGPEKPRPVFLDLRRIRLPVTGLVSILHRISGVLLFASLPFVVYLFDLSLRSQQGFAQAAALLHHGFVKIWAFLLLWSLLHHLVAGIRYLLIDFDIGVRLPVARASARGAIVSALVLAVLLGAILL